MKKRIVSSLLAMVVLASMLMVGIHAAEGKTLTACGPVGFKDAERVTYIEAVAVTGGIGLFSGTTDGRFAPLSNVNRAQMATIIVKMVKGADFNADSYKGEGNPFPDTASFEGGWAEGYINACAQLGIVKGYGDGTFQPGNPVTAAEALTMVLNALGIDAGASEWPATVMAKADQLKLADGLLFKPEADKVLNREQLAAIVYAGIQYKPEGGKALLSDLFGVDKIDTEHKYGETHCEVCRAAKPGVLTRADLEKAVVETAWAFYMKGTKFQYDSIPVSVVRGQFGGAGRLSPVNAAPEWATGDSTVYSVCSDYICKVYMNALEQVLYHQTNSYSSTDGFWAWVENQPEENYLELTTDPITENDVDTCILRWMSSDKDKTVARDVKLGVYNSPHFANFGDYHLTFANGLYPTTPEEQEMADNAVQEFLANWEKNLRPGDGIVCKTHSFIYLGNGYVLDSTSAQGGKYNVDSGTEILERNGTVYRLGTVVQYFVNSGYNNYYPDESSSVDDFIVFRPLELLVQADEDGDLSNDLLKQKDFAIPAKSLSRLAYPGMEIDRTVDITPYGTVVSGEELTYSIKITNKSGDKNYVKFHTYGDKADPTTDYKALPVSELVPAGTEFVRATGDYQLENGKLSWTVDVPAGQTVELTYTVKVTAPMGSKIISEGGFVADIPSNTITNGVGGKKLDQQALTVLKDIADADPGQWREKFNISALTSDLDFARRIYQKMGIDLQLPSLEDVVGNLYTFGKTRADRVSSPRTIAPFAEYTVFTFRDQLTPEYQAVKDMLLKNYYGGYLFFANNGNRYSYMIEFSPRYLEPGDILVYISANEADGAILGSETMVYAGKNSANEDVLLSVNSDQIVQVYVGEEVNKKVWKALAKGNALFFALRPSQSVEDINALRFDPANEPVYGEEPAGITVKPTQRGTTSLYKSQVAKLQSMTYGQAFGQRAKHTFAVYGQLDIGDLSKVFVEKNKKAATSALAVFRTIFTRTDDSTDDYKRTYQRNQTPESDLEHMLITNFYGGPWIPGTVGDTIGMEALQPGDILVMSRRLPSAKTGEANQSDLFCVYQGNGKFLVGGYYWAAETGAYGFVASGYKYGTLDFSGETPVGEFNFGGSASALGKVYRTVNDETQTDDTHGYVKVDSFLSLLSTDPLTGKPWNFYFALRPTQGVYDIHDLAYSPEADG